MRIKTILTSQMEEKNNSNLLKIANYMSHLVCLNRYALN